MEYIRVTFRIEREGAGFVSKCSELGIASMGDTEQEALDNIAEATELYLDTLEEHGECRQFLAESRRSILWGLAGCGIE